MIDVVLSTMTLTNLLLIVLGVVWGIIFGMIPGLTATLAVVVLIPATYGLGAVTGISMLIGIYIGGVSGGLVSAILIGMPGCGKSTVGKQLAAELGMDFADTDEEVEAAAGMSIPDIFERYGEEAFRRLESEQTQKLGKENRLVIATGGGIVKDPGNYARLKQNGLIFLLERDPALLSIKGRPLSKNREEVLALHKERIGLYESFADLRINSNCPIADVVGDIRERIGK